MVDEMNIAVEPKAALKGQHPNLAGGVSSDAEAAKSDLDLAHAALWSEFSLLVAGYFIVVGLGAYYLFAE